MITAFISFAQDNILTFIVTVKRSRRMSRVFPRQRQTSDIRAPPPPPLATLVGLMENEIICSRAKRATKTENGFSSYIAFLYPPLLFFFFFFGGGGQNCVCPPLFGLGAPPPAPSPNFRRLCLIWYVNVTIILIGCRM